MEAGKIHEYLVEKFGDTVVLDFQGEGCDPPFIYLEAEKVAEIVQFLKDDEGLAFDSLMNLSGVDFEDRIEVVYHLHSIRMRHKIAVKVRLNRESPVAPTVSKVHPVAAFHEREAFDLLGIEFTGHPDLRRILLPDDWPGHPLRKDYTYPDQYHGIKV